MQSEVGVGSTFEFSLRLYKNEEQHQNVNIEWHDEEFYPSDVNHFFFKWQPTNQPNQEINYIYQSQHISESSPLIRKQSHQPILSFSGGLNRHVAEDSSQKLMSEENINESEIQLYVINSTEV